MDLKKELYSNTTLVKVKFVTSIIYFYFIKCIQIQLLLKLNTNRSENNPSWTRIQIQLLLKLNRIQLGISQAKLSFKYNSC